jgi:putative peptidoglycan lipid II flippase
MGAVGITATTGLAAWIEFLMLRRTLGRRIGPTGIGGGELARLWLAAVAAAAAGLGVKVALARWRGPAAGVDLEWQGWWLPAPALHPVATGAVVLGAFGVLYFAITAAMGNEHAKAVVGRLTRRGRRG